VERLSRYGVRMENKVTMCGKVVEFKSLKRISFRSFCNKNILCTHLRNLNLSGAGARIGF
jgi:hypothetical protein